jgi:hypothetical protein
VKLAANVRAASAGILRLGRSPSLRMTVLGFSLILDPWILLEMTLLGFSLDCEIAAFVVYSNT